MGTRLVLALAAVLGLFLTPVIVPMVLVSSTDHDTELGGVPVGSGVPVCAMYCDEAPVSVPMIAPEVPGCAMFCDEVK